MILIISVTLIFGACKSKTETTTQQSKRLDQLLSAAEFRFKEMKGELIEMEINELFGDTTFIHESKLDLFEDITGQIKVTLFGLNVAYQVDLMYTIDSVSAHNTWSCMYLDYETKLLVEDGWSYDVVREVEESYDQNLISKFIAEKEVMNGLKNNLFIIELRKNNDGEFFNRILIE